MNSESHLPSPISHLPSPISHLPSPICSNEYQIVTNLVYLYPAYQSYKRGWLITATIYFITGIVSAIHHLYEGNSYYLKILDYYMASLYLITSTIIWWKYIKFSSVLVLCSFILSMLCMVFDHQEEVCGICHILWHLVTGLGVGYMISLIDIEKEQEHPDKMKTT